MTDNNETIKTIAILTERVNSLEARMTKNEDLIQPLHKLMVTVDNLCSKLGGYIDNNDGRMKSHGERIGEIEKKGSKKLEYIVGAIIMAGITALFMYFFGGDGL